MVTKCRSVRILKRPLNKWDDSNRATDFDPVIQDRDGRLMTNKLHTILRSYGERVAMNNLLTLEILREYQKKSRRLKKLEMEYRKLKKQNADLIKRVQSHSHS